MDGNGRTGRVINILYLIEQKLLDLHPVLSRYINDNRTDYYQPCAASSIRSCRSLYDPTRLPMKLISVEITSMVGLIEVLAVPDHVVVAGPAQHLDPVGGGAALTDEVDHGFRAVPAGQRRTCSTWVPSATIPWSAPISTARSTAAWLRSTTTRVAAEIAFSTWRPM